MSTAIVSCSKEEDSIERDSGAYIDIDVTKPFDQMTREEQKLFFVAAKRLEKYSVFENGQFYLTVSHHTSANLAPQVFDYFMAAAEQNNRMIDSLNVYPLSKNQVMVVPDNVITKAAVLTPPEPGSNDGKGVTCIKLGWVLWEIYISNTHLSYACTGGSWAAIIKAIGDAGAAAPIVWACFGSACMLAETYPKGVIIRILKQPGGGCWPYWMESQ